VVKGNPGFDVGKVWQNYYYAIRDTVQFAPGTGKVIKGREMFQNVARKDAAKCFVRDADVTNISLKINRRSRAGCGIAVHTHIPVRMGGETEQAAVPVPVRSPDDGERLTALAGGSLSLGEEGIPLPHPRDVDEDLMHDEAAAKYCNYLVHGGFLLAARRGWYWGRCLDWKRHTYRKAALLCLDIVRRLAPFPLAGNTDIHDLPLRLAVIAGVLAQLLVEGAVRFFVAQVHDGESTYRCLAHSLP
jgi:hypothetical protein